MSAPAITRTFAIADITPEELAAVFAAMDGAQQARFFSQVGKIAGTWRGAGWCQQSCAISEHLDKVGTETILKLGEWAADPYVAPTTHSTEER